MEFRDYDPRTDREAIHRIWRAIGWQREGTEQATDLFVEGGTAVVADVDGQAEGLAVSAPGAMRYLREDVPLSALTAVTVSQRVRKRGVAKQLCAELLARDATEGALVSALGMFEQGFYDEVGFGTGSYEHWTAFDPAQLKVETPSRVPVSISADDWEMVHAARLKRMRAHGSCNLLAAQKTRAAMLHSRNGFGFGYLDDADRELTHLFWCWTADPQHGPYNVSWMAYQTWGQFLDLMGIIASLGDQVHLVWMREPPGIQLQDLLKQPFTRRRVSERANFETMMLAIAYWQVRICDLQGCLQRTHLSGSSVRFNLVLTDPVAPFLEAKAWRGIGGNYVVTLGPFSGAEMGHDSTLPTLTATVDAFTRLWLGVRPATSLSVTDALKGPPELLSELDALMQCLPVPRLDWDF